MDNRIVFESPVGVRLLAGLDWQLLTAGANRESQLREHRKLGATHAVVVESAREAAQLPQPGKKAKGKTVRAASAGLYSVADGTPLPKNSHSLAAAFSRWTREHGQALLRVKVADDLYAVVVVVNGLPVIDKLDESAEQANQTATVAIQSRPGISVFSDDIISFPSSTIVDDLLLQILQATDKSTAIKAIPINLAAFGIAALILAIGVCGWLYYERVQAEKARQERLAKQRAADPIPKYLTGLAAARQTIGAKRESLKVALDAAQKIPLDPEGWMAKRIACDVATGCEVLFARTTGTYQGLAAAVPFLQLTPAVGINLNDARMTWKQELLPSSLDPQTELPPLAHFIQGADASKLQDWLVAGLTVQLTPPQLWPQVPGVPNSFKHPLALQSGKFELNGVALPQIAEALASAPANVKWTGWSLDIGEAKQEPLSRAKGRLTGNYYVTSN